MKDKPFSTICNYYGGDMERQYFFDLKIRQRNFVKYYRYIKMFLEIVSLS